MNESICPLHYVIQKYQTQDAATIVVVLLACILPVTGCGTPEPTEAERKERDERAAIEQKEDAKRRGDYELQMYAMKNARAIRERAYCSPSPEALGKLYELLKDGDSERAAAIADLTGTDVLEPKTKILVLNLRPIYNGIGANLVRINGTRRTCFVTNRALKTD